MLKVRWPFLHCMRGTGVTVFLGTDAAFGLWPGTDCWPGFQEMARAIEILVRWAGFHADGRHWHGDERGGRALGLDGDIGTIAPGRRADLVLLAEDPLADIRALRQSEMVFRDGHLVARRRTDRAPGHAGEVGRVAAGTRMTRHTTQHRNGGSGP